MPDPAAVAGQPGAKAFLAPLPTGSRTVLPARPGLPGQPFASPCSGGCPGDSSVVDFEGLGGPGTIHQLTTQFASLGVEFSNALAAVAPAYDSVAFPPRSGVASSTADVFAPGGPTGILYVDLLGDAVRVKGYMTSVGSLTLQCFNAADSLLGETFFAGGNIGHPVANQPVEVSAPGIRRCQFNGTNDQYSLDDLTVYWDSAVPTLSCNSVIRGQTGTCTVAGADSVLQWRFWGVLDSASRIITTDTIVADTSFVPDTTWAGTAVMSGTVSAHVRYGAGLDTVTLSAPWVVQPRTGSQWRWGPANWTLDSVSTPRKCGYPDLVLRWDGAVWKFGLGPNSNRLGSNRSLSQCGGRSVVPDLGALPDSGTTVTSDSVGPNAGLFYVAANSFVMHRVAEINDWLDATVSPIFSVTDPDDYNDCWSKMNPQPPHGTTITRSLFTFNSSCVDSTMTAYLTTIVAAIWAHEQFGTQGQSSLATANGHEARRRLAAGSIANDPRAIVESLVSEVSPDNLKRIVEQLVLDADARIFLLSGDHQYVNGNVPTLPTGVCLGAQVLWSPTVPAPKYYDVFPFATTLPDSTPGCP